MGFLQRSREDQLLFTYWRAINSALPNYSDETIIKRFIKDMGNYCEECTVDTLRFRLVRMKAEYLEDQKTPPTAA